MICSISVDLFFFNFLGWFEVDDASNNKVYVSNLPENTNEKEFVDLMQKCGLVMKDVETNNFKIKMYKDKEGQFKGDALCTYIKVNKHMSS